MGAKVWYCSSCKYTTSHVGDLVHIFQLGLLCSNQVWCSPENIWQHVKGLSFMHMHVMPIRGRLWPSCHIQIVLSVVVCLWGHFLRPVPNAWWIEQFRSLASIVDVESQVMTWMSATPEIPGCAWGIEEPEIQLRIAGGTLHQRVLQASRLKCWSTPRQKETHICALMVTVVGSKKDSNFPLISRLCPSTWYKKPGKIPLSSCLGGEKATCCHLSVDFSHWVVGIGFRDHDRGNWLSPLSR